MTQEDQNNHFRDVIYDCDESDIANKQTPVNSTKQRQCVASLSISVTVFMFFAWEFLKVMGGKVAFSGFHDVGVGIIGTIAFISFITFSIQIEILLTTHC